MPSKQFSHLESPPIEVFDTQDQSPLEWRASDEHLSVEFRKPSAMQQHHWHRQIEVNIPFGGDVQYLIDDEIITLPAQHIGLFWGITPHRFIESNQCQMMGIINIPLSLFLRLPAETSLIHPVMQGHVLISQQSALFQPHDLERWQQDYLTQHPAFTQLLNDEMLLMLRRIHLSGWHFLKTNIQPNIPQAIFQVKTLNYVRNILLYISAHYQEAIRIQQIADTIGLNKNYVITLFKQVMGYSIKTHIMHMKLLHARALLAETNRSILDISLATGFSALSRFYEAFQKKMGVTPHQYRQLNRQSQLSKLR